MKDKIKPAFVLTCICVISALLLVLANEVTKDSIAEQRESRFGSTLQLLFGECDYRLIDDDFGADEVESVAVTSDNRTAIQLCVDGYSNDGINVLVGIDESGSVCGIEFISLDETPGLGTKVRDQEEFREQFIGAKEPDSYEFDAVSGATFSSKGMKNAVDTALEVYNKNKEAILNG